MKNRRTPFMLGLGAAVGITLGAVGTFDSVRFGSGPLPDSAVARINDKIIGAEEFKKALNQLRRTDCDEITGTERASVLNGLVDQELLVQHGVERGVVDSDPSVREAISKAVIQAILQESTNREPSDEELKRFHEDHYGAHNNFLFDRLRAQVKSAYSRFAEEKALRDYLDWLWGEADITIRAEPPN